MNPENIRLFKVSGTAFPSLVKRLNQIIVQLRRQRVIFSREDFTIHETPDGMAVSLRPPIIGSTLAGPDPATLIPDEVPATGFPAPPDGTLVWVKSYDCDGPGWRWMLGSTILESEPAFDEVAVE